MSQMLTTVKTASKDILARCMATEDINVQHSASAETAAFDTESRTLILPVWEDMDNAVYDMLVGHEVSHALHTPMEGWQDFIGDGPGARMRHMFVNVVEDARIERLIKDKFPGLRRDFASAYKNLHDRDLFEIAGRTLDTNLPLIDRLNLEFKLGLFGLVDIPFSTDEKPYVTRMAETTTFEEVVQLAKELYEMQVEQDEENAEENQGGQPQASPESGDGEGEGSGSAPSDSDESGEGSGSAQSTDDVGDDAEGSSGSGNESGEDSGASTEDDTDDGESADSTTGENGESGDGEGDQPSDLNYDDYQANQDAAGSTQNAFERGVEDMRNTKGGNYYYSTLPTMDLAECVCDFKTIEELWTQYSINYRNTTKNIAHLDEQCNEWHSSLNTYMNSIKGIVAGMVQQFQMKQAADADKRTSVAKTGVLDTTTMINYRWSEDIFLKNEVHSDAKNHGMVMYIDWSGSMNNILQDTVEQLLVLVEFCRKVGIPYEVYAFSSNQYYPEGMERYSEEWDKFNANRNPQYTQTADTDCKPHEFQLYNFLSSRMNKREFNTGLTNFWFTMNAQRGYLSYSPSCLSLGCTPLNEAIVCAMDMVPAFQQANDIQIVNTVFLTDGEGHGMLNRPWGNDKCFVTDKKSKKTYEIERNRGETDALLNMLRDRTGTNLVGIRLHDSKNIRFMQYHLEPDEFARLQKQYKTQNYVTLPSSYDEYFLVKGDLKVETSAMDDLDEDASYAKIKNAFIKGGTRKKSSRVIANKMVDIFAA